MILAKNKEVDASKREDRKTRCIKSRSAIVVIIDLRDILSRIIVV
jgi:hypothetical protein